MQLKAYFTWKNMKFLKDSVHCSKNKKSKRALLFTLLEP